jgi:hypothetical protein
MAPGSLSPEQKHSLESTYTFFKGVTPFLQTPPFSIPCSISFCPHGRDSTCRFDKDARGKWHGWICIEGDRLATMLDSLAHELGHFVALSYRLPAAMADPRVNDPADRYNRRGGTLKERRAVLCAEHEAWRLALKIRPEINRREMNRDLETY